MNGQKAVTRRHNRPAAGRNGIRIHHVAEPYYATAATGIGGGGGGAGVGHNRQFGQVPRPLLGRAAEMIRANIAATVLVVAFAAVLGMAWMNYTERGSQPAQWPTSMQQQKTVR